MKKLFTSLLLLMAGVVMANAASSLKVGGTSIDLTKDGTYTIGSGTATFKKSTLTLSLKDISLSNNGISGYELGSSSSNFYINLESDLTITRNDSKGMGMRFDYSYVVITGNSHKITINNSANTNTGYPCIDAEESSFDIWNARLDLSAGAGCCFYGNKNKAILYFSRVYGDLRGDAGAIQGFKSATFDDCMLFTSGSKFVAGTGVTDAGGTLLTELQIRPNLMAGTKILRTASSSSEEGVASWDKDTKTLTLGWDYKATSGYPCIANYGIDGLVIKFDAARKLTSQNANCIELYKATKFTGSGKLTVKAGSAYTGIYPQTAEAVITIDGCNFEIEAGYGIDGTGISSTRTDLVINKSTISVTASHTAMARLKSATLTGCGVNTAETPVYFNSDKQGFTDLSGTWTDKVVIGVPANTYSNVKVCGQPVTNLNASNILVDGLTSGKIYFKENTNDYYFSLQNVTLTNNTNQPAFYITDAPKKVIFRCDGGTNTINQNGKEGIYVLRSGTLRMEGDGKVAINVTDENNTTGIRVFQTNLEVDLKGLDIVCDGRGIYAVGDNDDVKLIRRYSSTQYNIQGKNSGALCAGTLTFDQMDFDASETAGCYFNGHIYKNGSHSFVMTNVRFSPVTTTYGITIAGTPVTNCNRQGVGSKYITSGGPTAVTFDGSKTLTLTDATIDYKDVETNAIKNASVDGLTIKLAGTNVITNSQDAYNADNVPVNISANTTITGEGSLTVESLPIRVYDNANLTFKDAKNVTIKSSLMGQNSTSTSVLTVDNSNVKVNGYVCFFQNVTWPNGKLLTPVNGYYDTTERYMYDANGNKVKGVVFGDKDATGIDAVEIDSNAEVNAIYDAAGRQTTTAKRGLNIVRMSDGTVRKVMVK